MGIVRIGRYAEIGHSTELIPPEHPFQKGKFFPMIVGSHTRIGENCTIQTAGIGCNVWIGDNVKIGKRCCIKDNCIIESNTIIADNTVIPPFTRVTRTTNPTSYKELPPSYAVQAMETSIERYTEFKE